MQAIQTVRKGNRLKLPLIYSSFGDTNGVVYFIGSSYRKAAFANPHTAGSVTCVYGPAASQGTAADLVDRAYNDSYSTNAVGSFVSIDLGAGCKLIPNKYILRGATSTGNYLRSWKLQGTNNALSNSVVDLNAATWTDLDTQTNNTTINGGSQSVTVTMTLGSIGFRWLRIALSTNGDSAGANYCICSDFEFYGVFSHP